MHIIDSHFHWWPRSVWNTLCKRARFPARRAQPAKGGYDFFRKETREPFLGAWAEWFDLDEQLAHMDRLGHEVDVVCSIGPFSVRVLRAAEERRPRRRHAVERGDGRRGEAHPGRVWASAAVPLVDTQIAIEVLDHAVNKLGLMGVNLPGSVGSDPRIDAERLEPFYDRVEELGVPLFLHPTDAVFEDMLRRLWRRAVSSLGRVIEVSVAAMRARLLRHHGAASEPQGRDVAHRRRAALSVRPHGQERQGREAAAAAEHLHQAHVHRHGQRRTPTGMKFAIEYYGVDHVMYGTDYPCWDPAAALEVLRARSACRPRTSRRSSTATRAAS